MLYINKKQTFHYCTDLCIHSHHKLTEDGAFIQEKSILLKQTGFLEESRVGMYHEEGKPTHLLHLLLIFWKYSNI